MNGAPSTRSGEQQDLSHGCRRRVRAGMVHQRLGLRAACLIGAIGVGNRVFRLRRRCEPFPLFGQNQQLRVRLAGKSSRLAAQSPGPAPIDGGSFVPCKRLNIHQKPNSWSRNSGMRQAFRRSGNFDAKRDSMEGMFSDMRCSYARSTMRRGPGHSSRALASSIDMFAPSVGCTGMDDASKPSRQKILTPKWSGAARFR